MTLEEIGEIGRQCLQEQKNSLNVKGVRPFDSSAKHLAATVPKDIANIKPATARAAIQAVLVRLSEVEAFVMSEPPSDTKMHNIAHNDLRISFEFGSDVKNGELFLLIKCWYFPGQCAT